MTLDPLIHLGEVYAKTYGRSRPELAPADATEQLDTLTVEYATKNNVDRPTARVAVMKTAEGKRLYAESIGRAPVEVDITPEPLTKSKRDYESDLEALTFNYQKAHGCDRPTATVAVMKTAEGRRLYNMALRAERAGAL